VSQVAFLFICCDALIKDGLQKHQIRSAATTEAEDHISKITSLHINLSNIENPYFVRSQRTAGIGEQTDQRIPRTTPSEQREDKAAQRDV
jgi:hypothetical protein